MGHHGDLRLHTKSGVSTGGFRPCGRGQEELSGAACGLLVADWPWCGTLRRLSGHVPAYPMAPPSPWASLNPGLGEAG